MTEEKRINLEHTISILMQLDEKSLLLIDSGAKMLMARQRLDGGLADSDKQLANSRLESAGKEIIL